MPIQLILPFHAGPPPQMPAADPPAAGSLSHVAIPHWYRDPAPGADDFRAAEIERDAALAAWQATGTAFDRLDPRLPVLWSNIAEAAARAKRRHGAIHREWRRLEVSRERVRRMICLMPPPGSALELLGRGQVHFDRRFPELETLSVPTSLRSD